MNTFGDTAIQIFKQKRKFERLYLQKYSELQPRIWHAFIILTKVILGICWAVLETDTWEPLVELTRNDPKAKITLANLAKVKKIPLAKSIFL